MNEREQEAADTRSLTPTQANVEALKAERDRLWSLVRAVRDTIDVAFDDVAKNIVEDHQAADRYEAALRSIKRLVG